MVTHFSQTCITKISFIICVYYYQASQIMFEHVPGSEVISTPDGKRIINV
jgi:hypothetical protein